MRAVEQVADPAAAQRVLRWLERLAGARGGPVVDEAEERRLHRLAAGDRQPGTAAWLPEVGYASLARSRTGGPLEGDLVVRAASDVRAAVDLARAVTASDAPARWWIRQVDEVIERELVASGALVERRLHIVGRPLPAEEPRMPDGVVMRVYRPGSDEAEVAALLANAYEGTPDAGWSIDGLRDAMDHDWFVTEDVLLAEDGDGMAAIHWTKVHGSGVGEVHNLAVHPRARGVGLGRAVLLAGLSHLHRRGCEEVILWADEVYEAARALYTVVGFVPRWQDLAIRLAEGE